MELLLESLRNLSAPFLLELGNTISSLFGGGTTSDAKENGTDAVQVRAEKQTSKQLGLGDVMEAEHGRAPSCLDFREPPLCRLPRCCIVRFEPLPEPLAYCCRYHLPSLCSPSLESQQPLLPTSIICLTQALR